MKHIIITADDYGMCGIVDKAIDAGIENGFLSTTNVMTNMESLSNAATLRTRYPYLSVGVHWNVTTGSPVSNPADIPTLVQEDGRFYPITVFKKRIANGQISKEDLARELDAQYQSFYAVCGKADYWNTHENSSLSLAAYPVFAAVAKKYEVVATRTFERVYYDKINLGFKQALRELLVRNFFAVWFSFIRKDFNMPGARIVSFDKISKTEGDVVLQALLSSKKDYIELVFHPAVSAEHPYFGNISTERVKEYEFVVSPEIKEKYLQNGIEIVGYSAL